MSEMLRECAAPIVGLDKVREIKNDGWRFLLYICTICRVRNNLNQIYQQSNIHVCVKLKDLQ